MENWFYFFSKFTDEALLFEGLIFFLLLCAYSAFWVLRKRRYGAADPVIPSGAVRTYLSDLIGDAEYLKAQLFGILSKGESGSRSPGSSFSGVSAAGGGDSAALRAQYEAQLAEKMKMIDQMTKDHESLKTQLVTIEKEKETIIKEGGGSGADNSAELDELKKKIKELQARLDEYSIIEDDLANLKRLQQELAELKGNGAAPAAAEAAPPEPEPEPAAEPEHVAEAEPEPVAEEAAPEVEVAPVVEAEPAEIQEGIAEPPPDEGDGKDKSDADLLAEFEKMLNA